MQSFDRKKSCGFTLVELLVVISIIALLLAILMPSLRKARDQAKKVVCGSSMRSVGLMCAMYANDNKNYLPRGQYITGARRILVYHLLFESNYGGTSVNGKLTASDIWRCPGDREPGLISDGPVVWTDNYPAWTAPLGEYSYMYNMFLGNKSNTGSSTYDIACYSLTYHQPSKVAVLRDKPNKGWMDDGWCRLGTEFLFGPNHGESGYNMLFADGHVEWTNKRKVDFYWMPNSGYGWDGPNKWQWR